MTRTALLTAFALIATLLVASDRATCQNLRPHAAEDDALIRLNVRVVNLNVTVTDQQGRKVIGLTKDDFLVLENREAQEVIHFEPVIAPVNLVLLVDLSGSIGSKLDAVKKAAKKFIDSLKSEDNVAVGTFTSRFNLVSGFTTDRKLLKKRIDELEYPEGDTAFYDAAWAAFDLLEEVKDVRKAMVVLTDGVDSSFHQDEKGSTRSFAELMDRAVEEDASLYPIYFDTEKESDGYYSAETFATARRQLQHLGEQTGGAYFTARRIEDLDGVYRQVAAELHALYSVAYAAKDSRKDGKWRAINVRMTREGVKAKTKRGYFAK